MTSPFGFGLEKASKPKPKKQRKKDAEKPSKKAKPSSSTRKVIKAVEKVKEITEKYPVAVIKPKKGKISRLDAEAQAASILGSSAEEIQEYLESDDKERATALIYKRLMQTLVDTIPHAENTVRTTKGYRGVYQLNTLISSIRELMADLQSAQDRGRLGESLIERILRPTFMDLGMHIITAFTTMGEDAKDLMKKEDYARFKKSLDQTRSELGRLMNQQYAEVKNEVSKFFQQ